MMTPLYLVAFVGVGLEIFIVAWGTLAILVAAVLSAAVNHFFSSVGHFDDDLREATMDLSPQARRRFFELYESQHPKSPAVAWFLAVGLGPAGANLYRGEWAAFFGAVVTLNGLGAWWFESWFTTPHLVLMKNRKHIAWALFVLNQDESLEAQPPESSLVTPAFQPVLIAR
jgi:hypothetical protein